MAGGIESESLPVKRAAIASDHRVSFDQQSLHTGTSQQVGADQTAVHLDKSHVDTPIVSSDYRLLGLLVQYAHTKLAELENAAGFGKVVRQSIMNLVEPRFPTIETVSANLNMSVRTLQRRLGEEDSSFSRVLDELRRDLSDELLADRKLSVSEVAFMLGYSEPSAFQRAYRRWWGVSPRRGVA